MCLVFNVNRNGFKAQLHELLSARAKSVGLITVNIRDLYDQSRGIYGSLRIFFELGKAGVACSGKRLPSLMEQLTSNQYVARNSAGTERVGLLWLLLINCSTIFDRDELVHASAADISYFRTHAWCFYITVLLDLRSFAVAGWGMFYRIQPSL